MDKVLRERALRSWAAAQTQSTCAQWQMISGDASFRRYFRFQHGDRSIIAVDAPPDRENVQGFLTLAVQLRAQGLMVPDLFAQDPAQGFWLLEDFGDTLLLSVLNDKTVHRYYTAAIDELIRFQRIDVIRDYVLPHYDRDRFTIEVNLMPTWLLSSHLQYTLSATEQQMINATFETLIDSALAQPKVLTHRDFHARNLMVLPTSARLAIIDFQDTVWGPLTYDIVSLLKDCYIAWPRATVLAMLEYYVRQVQTLPVMQNVDREQLIAWFDLMGLQRHIKVLGIFCRLYYRDGKAGYLPDLPRVLEHAIEAALRYDSTRLFGEWLHDVIQPRLLSAQTTQQAQVTH
jgi:aminoglycoside/choline kinase family phosphotransferase